MKRISDKFIYVGYVIYKLRNEEFYVRSILTFDATKTGYSTISRLVKEMKKLGVISFCRKEKNKAKKFIEINDLNFFKACHELYTKVYGGV